jgi:uncharacterized membrane protein
LSQKSTVIAYLIRSLIGILILVIAVLFSSSERSSIDHLDRLFLGGAFITSCILGLSLALRPGWIRRINENIKGDGTRGSGDSKRTRTRIGHHPDCNGFSSHVIKINQRTLCTGCLGLALGSIISLLLIGLYIVVPLEANTEMYILLLLLGLFFIGMNFFEVIIRNKNSNLHLVSNVFLVIGFLLVVIGIFQLTAKIGYGILAVILSFLWLDTRIQLSSWNHKKICLSCEDTCKVYLA